jgi:Fe-Mn family superoxide dismutase
MFWTSLSKDGGKAPGSELGKAIDASFGSFDSMKEKLAKAALGVFGSGWAWLTIGKGHVLQIETTPNQDTPITAGRVPLLGIDVWEHAYYLKYQNKRADYVTAIFNVIDWNVIAERHAKSFIG